MKSPKGVVPPGRRERHGLEREQNCRRLVGTIGLQGAGLSWNPTDGRLYTVSGGDLHSIDPATGTPTLVGPVGHSCTGLAFDFGPVAVEESSWSQVKSRYRP